MKGPTKVDANDLLMGSGLKAAKFDNLGDTVIGTIVDPPKVEQAKKFGADNKPTAELDFWPSGDPKLNIVITLQTDQRDPADGDDDGKRRLFVSPRMQNTVRDAVKAASAPGLEVGGRLAVRWVGGTGVGAGNPREYAAQYARPVVSVGNDMLGGTTPAAQAAPATVSQAAPVATMAPAGQTDLFSAPAGPAKPASIDQTVWDRLDPVQRQAVSAAAAVQPPF
jgi:hypothetical protein